MLEIEFKRCVYLGTNNHSSRLSLSKFVVSKTYIFGENFCTKTLFPFRYFSIHVKMRVLLTYSAIKWV